MNPEHSVDLKQQLARLPQHLHQATITCPLCGATVPPRGLRFRQTASGDPLWHLTFTCPACGLVSMFDAAQISLKQLSALHGSAWTNELRQYRWVDKLDDIPFARAASPRHFIGVLVISFLTWMVLTGSFVPIDMLWGLVVSAIIARLSYRYVVFELPRWVVHPRRWLYFFDVLYEFIRQMIIQNVTLSIRVFSPKIAIRPGIVGVQTKLRGDVNLTILGALMTLTPDTVTLDMDQSDGMVYVHWIDVQSTDQETARRLLVAELEDRIIRWLL
jgi:multicomponent Na+:H+ antiporter subunit E